MNKVCFLVLLIFQLSFVNAQNHFTIGPEINIGNKQFSPKTGVGISLEYLAKIFPAGGIRGYAAYNHFSNKNIGRLKFIPVRIGYQHFLYSDNLFAFGEGGFTKFVNSGGKFGLSAATGIGYKLNIPEANLAQVSLSYNYNRYSSAINYNWFTLRAAYGIKFGKRKAFKRDE